MFGWKKKKSALSGTMIKILWNSNFGQTDTNNWPIKFYRVEKPNTLFSDTIIAQSIGTDRLQQTV